MRNRPAIKRHPFKRSGFLDFCHWCSAPERNRRYHPDIAWLHADTSLPDMADAVTGLLASDDLTLQAQLEVVLGILAQRYARICPVDIATIWPNRGLDRRRPIRAALAAGEHLEAAGELVRVVDFHRRPITVTRRVRGRDITAPIYTPTKGETPWPAP